jgi:phosphatidylserine decarboxylase
MILPVTLLLDVKMAWELGEFFQKLSTFKQGCNYWPAGTIKGNSQSHWVVHTVLKKFEICFQIYLDMCKNKVCPYRNTCEHFVKNSKQAE